MTDYIPATLNIPYYQELGGYEWVPDFLTSVRLQKEISAAKTELTRVRRAPAPNSEFRDKLAKNYQEHRQTRLESLAKWLDGRRESRNPFESLELWADSPEVKRAVELFPAKDIEDAVFLMVEPADSLSTKKRTKSISVLEQKLATLQEKLEEVSDPKYFTMRNGVVEFDKRVEFTRTWSRRQQKCCDAISPMGFPLNLSPAAEQRAHKQLQVDKALSSGGLRANPRRSDYRISAWPA